MKAVLSPVVCDRVRGHVSLMLDGELSQLEQRMVASHLERCADCQTFERTVREFTVKMREAPLESPRSPVVVARRARRAVLSAANVSVAAMLAVAVLGVVAQLGPTGRNQDLAPRFTMANLFTAGWKPEREIAQIDANRHPQMPGPSSAI
jgi:predicted anti-sigma-YlaC factor YlaD